MISKLTILKGARAILDSPNRWTRRSYARDANGRPVPIMDGKACSFCLVGALGRAAGGLAGAHLAERILSDELMDYAPDWNDDPERTHEEVIAVLDAAIEKLSR